MNFRQPPWRRDLARLIPAVVFLSMALPHLGQGAFSVDTGWYSAIAHQAWTECVDRGQGLGALWTLHGPMCDVDGQSIALPFFNKPPLPFWIHGAFLWWLGPTILAARLPAVLAGLIAVLVTQSACRRVGGMWMGVVGGIVLSTTLEFTRATHAFSLDIWMTMFLTMVLWCAVRSQAAPKWIIWMGAPLGLALLCKPFVALAGAVWIAIWLAGIGERGRLKCAICGVAVAVAVAAPWHVSMWILHGDEFVRQYLGREVLERAAGALSNRNDASAHWWYYGAELARNGWPWLATTVLGCIALLRREYRTEQSRWALLMVIWCVLWVGVLTVFPDRRSRYLLVVYPAAAILSAMFLRTVPAKVFRLVAWRRGPLRWAGIVAATAGIAVSVSPIRVHKADEAQWGALFAWLAVSGSPRLWHGGGDGAAVARLYLETGEWPVPLRSAGGDIEREPPVGAYIFYHLRGGWSPGAGEDVVLSAHHIRVTRLVGGGGEQGTGWHPIAIEDPGE